MTDIFSIKDFGFPKDFLWGSATAAHQIEGNNINSSNWDTEQWVLKENPDFEPSGMACNSYNMVEEDVSLLSDLGHRAYRFGIEWARIEPEEGVFKQEEVDHYLKELFMLKDKGIKTFVTLIHFSLPLWFDKKGGLTTTENWHYFERYLNFILPQISPYVDFWNVLNEFNGGISEWDINKKYATMFYHARGYHLIKKYSDKPVSSAHAFVDFQPKRIHDPFDRALAVYKDVMQNEFFFHAVRTGELVLPGKDAVVESEFKDTCDFWSINIYTREFVDTRKCGMCGERFPFSKVKMIPMDFYLEEFYPECVIHNLSRLTDKPVYITENGCSCDNDDFRIAYITEYLCAVNEAIQSGVDVRGYLYWSLLDNYEWSSFVPRFGLVDVDRKGDFKRTPKPSAWFYKEIIENNGFSQKILRKYLQEAPRL